MNKYFYFGLSTTAKTAALASALIMAFGWNAKAFSYLIDSEFWGTLAGVAVSVSAVLLALIIPMAYRKKSWVMLSLASVTLGGLMFGDAVLSVDAINITDETEKIEAINVENDPAVIAAKERYELARKAHERAQNILDPNGVANISNRNREREYADQCFKEYQAIRKSKMAAAAMVRPDRPLTNYAGALLLILAYSVLSLVSDIPMAKYRALAKQDVKTKKVTKVTEELQEDIVFQYKQLTPKNQETIRLFYIEAFAGETADHELARLRAAIRKDGIINNPNQNFSNWRQQVLSNKSGLNGISNNGHLAVSVNGKNRDANHI